MVRVSIFYPATEGARFDVEYYLNIHAPLALSRLGNTVTSFEIDIATHVPPMPKPSFIAAAHYICPTVADFMNAYLPFAEELQADVINYTDIAPILQHSHVHSFKPMQA